MNWLNLTLFFNIVAGIDQTFIKSWNHLIYPRVIEDCRLKKVVRDQRWPTAPLFIVNISASFGEFMAPLSHILEPSRKQEERKTEKQLEKIGNQGSG